MKRIFIGLVLLLPQLQSWAQGFKLLPPERQGAYFGAYADFGPQETEVTAKKIDDFVNLAGKQLTWVYFSNHWLNGKVIFPEGPIDVCIKKKVIPYIRFCPWSEMEQNQKDPLVSMQKIIQGDFDDQLRSWAQKIKNKPTAVMIEFGPEVNGDWFPWNGKWNGGSHSSQYGDPVWPDGPERFRDAYRHVIDVFRQAGVTNVTWVLHLDTARSPEVEWNSAKYYYPGDDYIDWIGLSVFGRQLPENRWLLFPRQLKSFLPELAAMTQNKPFLIVEAAVIEDAGDTNRKALWIKQAFNRFRAVYLQT